MANSVKIGTKIDSKVAAVVGLIRHPNNKGKIMCVVEGDDDVMCYSRLTDNNKMKCYPVGGCEALEYVTHKLHKTFGYRMIAIRDADFGRLNNVYPSCENLFWTDYHDIEMMLLDNGNAYDICQKYCYGKYPKGVFEEIQNELINVSFVRWFSQKMHDEKGQLGICFDNTPICPIIYTANEIIKLEQYWTYLMSKQEHMISYAYKDVEFFISQTPNIDLLELTNGHEVMSALWCKIKLFYPHNLSKKELKRDLWAIYSLREFKRTKLYVSINIWLEKHNYSSIWSE